MSRVEPLNHGLFEALPGDVLRAADHTGLHPLIDPESRVRILAAMDDLCVPVQTVCYECRLGSGDTRVDAAVCLFPMRATEAGDVLGRLGWRHRAELRWQRCLEFLAEWSRPASPFAAQIPFVCVAFDRPSDPTAVSAPCLSLCVDPGVFARQLGFPVPPIAPVSELLALADSCHGRLRGEALPAGCRAVLENCLASGEPVIARHISFMLSRAPATFKLNVRLPVDGVASLLQRIGWPGPVSSVVARIRELMPWQGQVQLNLVLHPELGASLEVEFLTGRQEAGIADRMALLQKLVDANHCDPAKAEVLRAAWAHPVSRGGDGVIVARSWYLKARFDGDTLAEAKAYLGFMPRVWCSSSVGRMTPRRLPVENRT